MLLAGARKVTAMKNHLSFRIAAVMLIALTLVAMSACAGQVYSSFLAEQRNRCYSVPKENYDACMREAKERYEAYKKEQQSSRDQTN
jgi:hypothetical protein